MNEVKLGFTPNKPLVLTSDNDQVHASDDDEDPNGVASMEHDDDNEAAAAVSEDLDANDGERRAALHEARDKAAAATMAAAQERDARLAREEALAQQQGENNDVDMDFDEAAAAASEKLDANDGERRATLHEARDKTAAAVIQRAKKIHDGNGSTSITMSPPIGGTGRQRSGSVSFKDKKRDAPTGTRKGPTGTLKSTTTVKSEQKDDIDDELEQIAVDDGGKVELVDEIDWFMSYPRGADGKRWSPGVNAAGIVVRLAADVRQHTLETWMHHEQEGGYDIKWPALIFDSFTEKSAAGNVGVFGVGREKTSSYAFGLHLLSFAIPNGFNHTALMFAICATYADLLVNKHPMSTAQGMRCILSKRGVLDAFLYMAAVYTAPANIDNADLSISLDNMQKMIFPENKARSAASFTTIDTDNICTHPRTPVILSSIGARSVPVPITQADFQMGKEALRVYEIDDLFVEERFNRRRTHTAHAAFSLLKMFDLMCNDLHDAIERQIDNIGYEQDEDGAVVKVPTLHIYEIIHGVVMRWTRLNTCRFNVSVASEASSKKGQPDFATADDIAYDPDKVLQAMYTRADPSVTQDVVSDAALIEVKDDNEDGVNGNNNSYLAAFGKGTHITVALPVGLPHQTVTTCVGDAAVFGAEVDRMYVKPAFYAVWTTTIVHDVAKTIAGGTGMQELLRKMMGDFKFVIEGNTVTATSRDKRSYRVRFKFDGNALTTTCESSESARVILSAAMAGASEEKARIQNLVDVIFRAAATYSYGAEVALPIVITNGICTLMPLSGMSAYNTVASGGVYTNDATDILVVPVQRMPAGKLVPRRALAQKGAKIGRPGVFKPLCFKKSSMGNANAISTPIKLCAPSEPGEVPDDVWKSVCAFIEVAYRR